MADQDEDLVVQLGEDLWDASAHGEAAEAARLIDLNAPINHRMGVAQVSPLMIAAQQGRIEVVTLLSSRGGDVEARSIDGQNALIASSGMGFLDIVQILVERSADIEVRDKHGQNALFHASNGGKLAVVQYLASKVSSINTVDNDGEDALLRAALRGFPDVVLFLISKGGDPRVVDRCDASALTRFGFGADPRPSPEEKQRAQEQFLTSWKAGCHPDARWLRRRGLMLMLAGCGFQPLAYRKAQLKAAALPTDAKIPPLPNKTRRQKLALLHGAVLGHTDLMKLVASFM